MYCFSISEISLPPPPPSTPPLDNNSVSMYVYMCVCAYVCVCACVRYVCNEGFKGGIWGRGIFTTSISSKTIRSYYLPLYSASHPTFSKKISPQFSLWIRLWYICVCVGFKLLALPPKHPAHPPIYKIDFECPLLIRPLQLEIGEEGFVTFVIAVCPMMKSDLGPKNGEHRWN